MKRESRLHFIEHCNVSIKQTDNLVKMRIVALNNGSNVFQSLLAFDFGSIIERHGIIYSVICSKDNGSIFIISDIVRCAVIDINNIKFVHRLHPFKIVIPRFCSLFLATLTFCVFRLSLLHPPFLYLSSTLQQSQKVRTRPFLYIICCVHNLILFFFQRQSYE